MTNAGLIAKLEAASEGSGTLDIEIARAVYGNDGQYREFTRSLDAALTLVPEGAFWGVGHSPDEQMPDAVVTKYKPGANFQEWEYHEHGYAATAPLALCIAALRALEAKP